MNFNFVYLVRELLGIKLEIKIEIEIVGLKIKRYDFSINLITFETNERYYRDIIWIRKVVTDRYTC